MRNCIKIFQHPRRKASQLGPLIVLESVARLRSAPSLTSRQTRNRKVEPTASVSAAFVDPVESLDHGVRLGRKD